MKITNKAKQLVEWDHTYLWHPFTQMKEWAQEPPLIIEKGRGPYLFDIHGRRYLDGMSSMWVNTHGHHHTRINQAIRRQLDKIGHSTLLGLSNPPAIVLARELVRISPRGLTRVFYSDDGSTAVEVALKMAVQYWQQQRSKTRKQKFIHLTLAYHGDTVGGMSLSGVNLFQKPFRSLVFSTLQVNPPYCYRCPLNLQFPSCDIECLDPLEQALKTKNQEIAGVIIEPMVQAVAGMIPSPPGHLRRVRELCTKYDVLLIADEVATGFGRTGRMFACEHEAVTPDFLVVAKGLTGGYLPLAATITTEEVFRGFLGDYGEWKTFFHGHSYTGNQLGCVAALANLEVFQRERTLTHMKSRIKQFQQLLQTLYEEPLVGDIRQCGYMVGIELVKNRSDKTPFSLTDRIGHHVAMVARERGVLIRPIGNVVVLMPPFCAQINHLRKMVSVLKTSIRTVTAQNQLA